VDAAKAVTFQQAAERMMASHEAAWRNPKHRAQWRATLATYVYPTFGGLSVGAVDTGLVLRVLEPIWTAKPETASRVRGRIETVLDWAKARGYREGENPATWRGHLDKLLPNRRKVKRVEHHAAMPYAALPSFMGELGRREGVSARALEFAILTACRTGEVIGARWSEIEGDVWTIPADRMKAGAEHRVPLSRAALDLLGNLPREGEFVFIGGRAGRPLSNMAMLELVRGMRPGLTVHGFRSTFRDWAAERTEFPNHVVEKALAHKVADKVEAAYRRGDLFDKRRSLMDAWAGFCGTSTTSAEVVAIRGKA
jgi:integrase